VLGAARLAYGAIAAALAESGGPFLLGGAPCVADAAVFGHLCAVRQSAALVALLRDDFPSLPAYWARLREGALAGVSAQAAAAGGNAFARAEAEAEERAGGARAPAAALFGAAAAGAAQPLDAASDAGRAQRSAQIRTIVATLAIFAAAGVIAMRAAARAS
jgi:hypothetical protein